MLPNVSDELTETALRSHTREIHHEGPKAYLCSLCGKSFATVNMLNHHIKKNSWEKFRQSKEFAICAKKNSNQDMS